jgi:hypothetical protein
VRLFTIVGVLLASATAHADGVAIDLGLAQGRVAVTDRTDLTAKVMRFALRGDLDHWVRYLHIGAEAEEGTLSGSTSLSGGAVARTDPESSPGAVTVTTTSPLEGNVLALKAFVGFHANAGMLRLGADVATGRRDSWVSGDAGMDVAGRKWESLFELRSRVDVRVSERWLVGAMAATDLLEHRDVSLGVNVTLDCSR